MLSRRDQALIILRRMSNGSVVALPWSGLNGGSDGGLPDQPWRITKLTSNGQVNAAINPQLFWEGVGALGGGNVSVDAGGAVSDLTTTAQTSLATSTATTPGEDADPRAPDLGRRQRRHPDRRRHSRQPGRRRFGHARHDSGRNIGNAGSNETRVRIDDAVVDLMARGDLQIAGIEQLDGYYSDRSALNLTADGSVTVTNTMQIVSNESTGAGTYAVYPGTLTVAGADGRRRAPDATDAARGDRCKQQSAECTGGIQSRRAGRDPDGAEPGRPAQHPGGRRYRVHEARHARHRPELPAGPLHAGGSLALNSTAVGNGSPPNAPYQWGSIGFPR